jgi:hypothetical protein
VSLFSNNRLLEEIKLPIEKDSNVSYQSSRKKGLDIYKISLAAGSKEYYIPLLPKDNIVELNINSDYCPPIKKITKCLLGGACIEFKKSLSEAVDIEYVAYANSTINELPKINLPTVSYNHPPLEEKIIQLVEESGKKLKLDEFKDLLTTIGSLYSYYADKELTSALQAQDTFLNPQLRIGTCLVLSSIAESFAGKLLDTEVYKTIILGGHLININNLSINGVPHAALGVFDVKNSDITILDLTTYTNQEYRRLNQSNLEELQENPSCEQLQSFLNKINPPVKYTSPKTLRIAQLLEQAVGENLEYYLHEANNEISREFDPLSVSSRSRLLIAAVISTYEEGAAVGINLKSEEILTKLLADSVTSHLTGSLLAKDLFNELVKCDLTSNARNQTLKKLLNAAPVELLLEHLEHDFEQNLTELDNTQKNQLRINLFFIHQFVDSSKIDKKQIEKIIKLFNKVEDELVLQREDVFFKSFKFEYLKMLKEVIPSIIDRTKKSNLLSSINSFTKECLELLESDSIINKSVYNISFYYNRAIFRSLK